MAMRSVRMRSSPTVCGPREEKYGQNGGLAGVETERLMEHLAVAHDRAAVGGEHEANQLLFLEHIERGEHRRLVVADDRLPVRGLVAG